MGEDGYFILPSGWMRVRLATGEYSFTCRHHGEKQAPLPNASRPASEMTKREMISAMVVAHLSVPTPLSEDARWMALRGIAITDALLAELDKEQDEKETNKP